MSLGTDKKQLLTGSKVERGVLGSICDYSHTHTQRFLKENLFVIKVRAENDGVAAFQFQMMIMSSREADMATHKTSFVLLKAKAMF